MDAKKSIKFLWSGLKELHEDVTKQREALEAEGKRLESRMESMANELDRGYSVRNPNHKNFLSYKQCELELLKYRQSYKDNVKILQIETMETAQDLRNKIKGALKDLYSPKGEDIDEDVLKVAQYNLLTREELLEKLTEFRGNPTMWRLLVRYGLDESEKDESPRGRAYHMRLEAIDKTLKAQGADELSVVDFAIDKLLAPCALEDVWRFDAWKYNGANAPQVWDELTAKLMGNVISGTEEAQGEALKDVALAMHYAEDEGNI